MPRKRALDLDQLISPDSLAKSLCEIYDTWRRARLPKDKEWAELRNYLFATSTRTTSNATLPWKNKTTRPKLCQIRDNLHANYMAALFPNDRWFKWQAGDLNAATKEKADVITAYMRSKLRESGFKKFVSQTVYDYIDYGNCVGDAEYVYESWKDSDGNTVVGYIGPRAVRVSPLDFVMDPTSSDFAYTPKFIRTLSSLGSLAKSRKEDPAYIGITDEIWSKMTENRNEVGTFNEHDIKKSEGYTADGFGSLTDYYRSGYVEVLEFEGDYYDRATDTLYENYIISIVDRAYIIRKEPIKSWTGKSTKNHAGWRLRPDNLWAMGPLDNLVGLQYRIDHLENLKADVFDMIAYPMPKIRGEVEEFKYGPGEKIFMDTDAEVDFLRPDTTALNADLQIQLLLDEMEEMAGAPKQAMGFRTPGEKTAFEIQSLENASGRIFQHKIAYFEEHFLEPILNAMLELARRQVDLMDTVAVLDTELGVTDFLTVTPDMLKIKGKLVPMGARHFAAQAQLVQNLTGLTSSGIWQDPGVRAHLSGKRIAELTVENMGLAEYGVYQPNVGVIEQLETEQTVQTGQQLNEMQAMTPTDSLEDQLEQTEFGEASEEIPEDATGSGGGPAPLA